MITKTLKTKLFCSLAIVSQFAFSQTQITLDPTCQRFLGEVSTLDRTKYFSIHDTGSGAEETKFRNDYGVTGGRQFWGAFARAKQLTGKVGEYPVYKNGNDVVRTVKKGVVGTHHPKDVFVDGIDVVKAGDWAAEYYKDFVTNGSAEEFVEVMNEPFVHANEFYEGWNTEKNNSIMLQMAELYNEVGKRIHSTPALQNMKVIGYSSAWPSVEIDDFQHWNDRMKMFMDVAGENMYAFSTHLYDGINVTGQDNKRSGSNSEAILDLIENYSYIKWNKIKPHAITEYGAIEKGYGDDYSKIASAQTLRSINNILFNLLDRQDRLVNSIPFITGKATWHINEANDYQPYQAVLFIPTNIGEPTVKDWEYSPRIHFYDLWKNVQGDRVLIKSNNVDIQTQAFVDGNTMYVALNNLDEQDQTLTLPKSFKGQTIKNVSKRSLKVYSNQLAEYTDKILDSSPTEMTLLKDETVVLVYTFEKPITYVNTIRTASYYSTQYLQSIKANTAINYNFNNVDAGDGYVTLRMSISRKHNKSKQPIVKVNGVDIEVPTNWKGYDQANRDDFFGMIEIPVPSSLLSDNNRVSITFPDADGRISSLILNVEKYKNPINLISIKTVSSPCPNANNGSITIKASILDDYNVWVKSNTFNHNFNFKENYTLTNLAPSSYDVQITSKSNEGIIEKYQVTITEAQELAVESKIDDRLQKLHLNLFGANLYYIQLNNQEFVTTEEQINLDLTSEKNHLVVKTENDCQGIITKDIFRTSRIYLSSSLINNSIEINLSEHVSIDQAVKIELVNMYGNVVLSKQEKPTNQKIELEVADLSKGLYLLNIKTKEQEFFSKILKK
ncbi:hypothetical protein FHR24_002331 [Wenyingzhuangia heitensis]|uniref:Por secretion system C-terminal sorting domain-containing protein n=1 Tax=Wenyingzhuangia heitensis TaxID=1487859 RepID=A0ABX0UD98_9FLAO|nr:T9SS type A sorting domain-containing protein [Wenyingzhuangia heitensis]NIJ45860.1 hypothetical protein [Wenyingzhuangia heitensis]